VLVQEAGEAAERIAHGKSDMELTWILDTVSIESIELTRLKVYGGQRQIV
jgi:hypothetical protein